MLHVEDLVSTLRFFGKGRRYGDPYDTVATIIIVHDFAIMVAMHGTMTLTFWKELQEELKSRGIKDLLTIRHGDRTWYDVYSGEKDKGRFPEYKKSPHLEG